jgi:hypothetical protein
MCPFLCHYLAVLISAALQYVLNLGSIMPPALSILLDMGLQFGGFVVLYKIRIAFSSSVKNAIGNFSGISLNL